VFPDNFDKLRPVAVVDSEMRSGRDCYFSPPSGFAAKLVDGRVILAAFIRTDFNLVAVRLVNRSPQVMIFR
jgi:hypothetical protein